MRLPTVRKRPERLPGVRRGRGVQIGRDVRIELGPGARLVLGDGCQIGERTRIAVVAGCVELGPDAVLAERCTLVAHHAITIGAGARLGHGVALVDFDHVFADAERPIRLQPLACTPVTIGEGARIGLGAGILRGVTVGAAAIVDPHAVVSRDVAPGAHVGGVPAKPI
jgi:acetyltransferase-like isoleucine patch superfamily enzyme